MAISVFGDQELAPRTILAWLRHSPAGQEATDQFVMATNRARLWTGCPLVPERGVDRWADDGGRA